MAERTNEQFTLPDGTVVGTGNNFDPDGLKLTAAQFPDELLLDNADIKRLMDARSLEADRADRSRYMMNQGQLGTCNWYMIISMFYQMQNKQRMPHTALAPEHGYMHTCGGADNGTTLPEGMKQMMNRGCCSFGMVPYENYKKSNVSDLAAADKDGMRFRIHEPYVLPSTSFEDFVRAGSSAIARGFPIGAAWHVSGDSMKLRGATIGNMKIALAVHGRGRGNHATELHSGLYIGGSQILLPDFKNSWGPCTDERYGRPKRHGWGEKGFGLTTWEALWATREFHDFWVGTSVTEDTQSASPLG